MITKENQIKFYTEELKEIEFSVKKTFNSLALSLFQNGEILVGQYKGFDQKRANMFVDIPIGKSYHSPRLDQKFTCFTLAPGLERPTKWTDISYVELLKDRNRTDTKIIDFTTSKREGWITMLIREIDSEFVNSLQYNQILGFGPVIPPYEYIENLLAFSKGISADQGNIWNDILSFKYRSNKDNYPILLTEEIDIAELIIEKVDKSKVFILQGPPGTGKTHQIADLASRLVSKGKSVVLTALTNKAALEVCTKSFFDKLFDLEKIFKLPLLLDEKRRFPKLLATDNLLPVKGHLNLTTYYQFSKIWENQTQTYDYVIVEEASQAFLTTLAAACKVGKKVIIIGDPKQIVPIVSNKDFNKIPNVSLLVNGMQTVSNIEDFSYYRKVETRRLTKRACMFTNSFYENTMVAKSLIDNLEQEIKELNFLKQYIPNQGGPVLVRFKNVNILEQMIEFLVKGINELSGSGKNEIAVLTPYVDTLKILQQDLKQKTVAKNFLIESVDRIQGLDVDYCFYVVAKSSSFSFDTNRFNVATSRAKKVTFILVEEDFDKLLFFSNEVFGFLRKFKDEIIN